VPNLVIATAPDRPKGFVDILLGTGLTSGRPARLTDMEQLVVSAAAFAFGLFLLPILFPEIRLKGAGEILKVGVIGGVLSAVLGKVVWILLSLVFFPIVLLGSLGVFLVQVLVNLGLLWSATFWSEGIAFKRVTTALWAAVALTMLQWLVRLAG